MMMTDVMMSQRSMTPNPESCAASQKHSSASVMLRPKTRSVHSAPLLGRTSSGKASSNAAPGKTKTSDNPASNPSAADGLNDRMATQASVTNKMAKMANKRKRMSYSVAILRAPTPQATRGGQLLGAHLPV